jgi:histidine ammonia-lyase
MNQQLDSGLVYRFGDSDLSVGVVARIARRQISTRLSASPEAIGAVERSAEHVARLLANGGKIYGVNTGYGDSVVTSVPMELVEALPLQLTRFHGCGLGRLLSPEETRSVLAVRLVTLMRGWSGVSLDLVKLLAAMIEHDILPLIPAEGSVGASGDLTPLSYVAGALAGEREVAFNGEVKLAREAFAEIGLEPIVLKPKEGLAVMNGTSVMAGLTALALDEARRLSMAACRLTAMTSLAILGNPDHFDERLFRAKPHPGQADVAARIRADLAALKEQHAAQRMQDRYSIRCAPHVIGVIEDILPSLTTMLETEINSANDNPLFDPDTGEVLHGGHFYGGHVCHVADTLKTQLANIADLADRQLATLVDARFNNGLPANLVGAEGPRAAINHGFKAVQIAVSAWTAEALKLTMPASVFSRSTECHNQDKVSMGTIAARDAVRVGELTAQVLAAHYFACVQAIEIRAKRGELSGPMIGAPLLRQMEQVRDIVPFLEQDTRLDRQLAEMTALLRSGGFDAGA